MQIGKIMQSHFVSLNDDEIKKLDDIYILLLNIYFCLRSAGTDYLTYEEVFERWVDYQNDELEEYDLPEDERYDAYGANTYSLDELHKAINIIKDLQNITYVYNRYGVGLKEFEKEK